MLSLKIKELREEAGLSQADLAKLFGLTQSTVGGWESDARTPKLDMLCKLADYFNVTTDYLLDRAARTEPQLELTEDERELLEAFRQLDHKGRRQLFGRAYDLLDQSTSDSFTALNAADA